MLICFKKILKKSNFNLLAVEKIFFIFICIYKKKKTMALNVDPPNGAFPASGGTLVFKILNQIDTRLAFKVIINIILRYFSSLKNPLITRKCIKSIVINH